MRLLWIIVFLGCFAVPSFADERSDAAEFATLQTDAAQGNAVSQFILGHIYELDDPLTGPHDYEKAAKWYLKAAEQGNAAAQVNLGVLYHDGRGVPQNYEEAYFWMILGSTSGDKNAAALRDKTAGLLTRQQVSEIQKRAAEWKPNPAP